MKRQYCRVGTTTPLTNEEGMISLLESRYITFLEMATKADTGLEEFFNSKAVKIRKTLEKLN